MDKNTITGIILIGLVLFGFSWLNKPTQEQIEAHKRYQDSILAVQAEEAKKEAETKMATFEPLDETISDSARQAKAQQIYGEFAQSALNKEQIVLLKNDLVTIEFSTKGANVKKVILNEYQNFKKEPLTLFDGTDNQFCIDLPTVSNRVINTRDLNFSITNQTEESVTFSLLCEGNARLDFIYTLPANSYMVNFDVKSTGLSSIIKDTEALNATWKLKVAQQEKGRTFENRYAQIYYYTFEDDEDYLSESSNDKEEVKDSLRWIAFKDQYFSSILIANGSFANATLESKLCEKDSVYLKDYKADIAIPYQGGNATIGMRYFFGPNHYKLLKSYDENLSGDEKLNLKRIIPLGWMVFRWVNQIFTIPMFNFLGSFLTNYGIIILIMTIVLKLIIFPLTYKSYLSSAKMRVLKPQIDEINQRIPEDKPTERSQATMELYSKAGVNPMGGCLPLLLQMPFLVAFFYFFPNAIELRGQSFLWADDLSTYDAIVSWKTSILGFDHISLFCLLMTITNIVYTKINMAATDNGQMNQMPFMKYMMYLMPIMFLFIFNDYASGLSYYYFISLLITIIQTFIIRKYFVDEEKLLIKIKENQKKPMSKSSWLSRIEEMQKQQQAMMEQQQQKKK